MRGPRLGEGVPQVRDSQVMGPGHEFQSFFLFTQEYLFIAFRERGREREKHPSEKHRLVATHMDWGLNPKAEHVPLTENQTHNLLVMG